LWPLGQLLDAPENFRQLDVIECFLLKKFRREAIENGSVGIQDFPGFRVSLVNETANFLVDALSNRIGVIPLMTHVPAKENLTAGLS
jgi:hypothetical protein